MSIARKLYPECEREYDFWGYVYDYQPIIDCLGNPIIQVDDNNYQGDSRILYKKGEKYGILIFGWGSCSGCDALQSCRDYEEIDDLIKELKRDIKWFDSAAECLDYIENKDWNLEWSWHSDETKEFIEKCKEALS